MSRRASTGRRPRLPANFRRRNPLRTLTYSLDPLRRDHRAGHSPGSRGDDVGAWGQQQASTELSHAAFWRQSREIPAGLSQARTSSLRLSWRRWCPSTGWRLALLPRSCLAFSDGLRLDPIGAVHRLHPHSLLSGFFTAAGIVLVVTQVLPAIGLPPAPGGVAGSVKA